MCSVVNEKSSLKTIRHCSPHLQLWFSGSEIVVFATWPIDLRLLKYFGTSKKFLRTSGFLQATCPGQVAEKKIWSPLNWFTNMVHEIWKKSSTVYIHLKYLSEKEMTHFNPFNHGLKHLLSIKPPHLPTPLPLILIIKQLYIVLML